MKIRQTLKEKYYSDKVLPAEWILAAVVGLFVFMMTSYSDMQSLTVWSTNVWDVILDSNIFHLYEYTAQNVYHIPHQYLGSELMSVLPWSVWNLPIWAIQRFCGVPIIDTPLMMAWSKLFLVVLTLVVLRYTYKIAMVLTQDSKKSIWAVFLTGSSLYTYIAVCYAGQNDILMITASVIAVYYLLNNKNAAFYIISAVAIAIKPFFLIPYFMVILLKEKNIIKIFLKLIISVSGVLLQKVIFSGAPMYSESINSGPSADMFKEMFPTNISTSVGPVSFFAVALVIICFYSYTRAFNKESNSQHNLVYAKYVIYIITVTYMCYIMFSPFTYYRVGMLIPFLYLMIIQNEKIFMYNVLLDIAMSCTVLLRTVLRGSPIGRIRYVNGSIMQGLLGYKVDYHKEYHKSVGDVINRKFDFIKMFQPLFSSVAFIAGLMLILLNHPSEKIKLPVNGEKCPRVVFWIRTLIIVPLMVMILLLFLRATNKIY